MNKIVIINELNLKIKEWNGQRIVTFKDIDKLHQRPEGTARKRFNENRDRFIKGEDYFSVNKDEFLKSEKRTLGFEVPNRGLTLITESGYLMLVKSFTDDLAWDVQRKLVKSYFRFKEVVQSLEPSTNGLILPPDQFTAALDTLTKCADTFSKLTEIVTINYKQQQELLQCAKSRVNYLLGGAHSEKYKLHSRMYFKNLWMDFGAYFECSTYKDLNPIHMEEAKEFLKDWNFD